MLLYGDRLGKESLVGKVMKSWGRSTQAVRGGVALLGGQEHISLSCVAFWQWKEC